MGHRVCRFLNAVTCRWLSRSAIVTVLSGVDPTVMSPAAKLPDGREVRGNHRQRPSKRLPIAVSEVVLDEPQIVAAIGEVEAA
jgi:hypothetical protein